MRSRLSRERCSRNVAPSGERNLIDPQRAHQRVRAQARDERSASDDDAGLRAAEQLIAGKRDELDAVGDGLLHRSFVRKPVFCKIDERAAAKIFNDRNAGLAAKGREFCAGSTSATKPSMRKLDGCDRNEQRRSQRESAAAKILEIHVVRRADFHERRAAAFEHVRQPKTAADLDQLIARDDRFAASRERIEDEQDGRGAVVHDERILRAGELAEQSRHAVVTRTALIPRSDRTRGSSIPRRSHVRLQGRGSRQRSAPEIRVQQGSGRIDDREKRFGDPRFDTLRHPRDQ